MPYSDEQGKDWLSERIVGRAPTSILDIGVGAGAYAHLLRPKLPDTRFIGIEVYEPYVPMFSLESLYDELIIADARFGKWPTVDVVIMGDVLEHMTYDDAIELWGKARDTARSAVYVSLPIIEYPQGPMYGNEHEVHEHTWSHADVMDLHGIESYWTGSVLGCYEVRPT